MNSPLLIVAGAKGAVGSTVAAAVASMKQDPQEVLPWMTTNHWIEHKSIFENIALEGWDVSSKSLKQSIEYHKVLPREKFIPYEEYIDRIQIRRPPSPEIPFQARVEQLIGDIESFRKLHPDNHPVLINLLPACQAVHIKDDESLDRLYPQMAVADFPDLSYMLAAIHSGVPVVNFTSNTIELPLLVREAQKARIPLCGRDGKTGQTYLKVVLASAFKARKLHVDGWYSLNILGNDDGRNLANPDKATGKVANKTELLDDILGYEVGRQYGISSHKVVIDYYPPRGDCKEAWDVIDFTGLFGLPMSLRLNLQVRDSILAAPMVMDLALWMVALHKAGRSGLIPELGFYFKKPVGTNPPVTFQDQLDSIRELGAVCRNTMKC